ncbi:MAG: SRPBCC family protein [Actinomycetota bacterium]|nr:SRPBCC family protein [Actinomycetota bacterium]
MRDSVTVHMAAPADKIWALVSDVTNTEQYSEETFEAEWLDGATGPAVGTRFRGHVLRNGRPPAYWTKCRITACEPGKEFGFVVLVGSGTEVSNWHYRFTPSGQGTDVTESFRLEERLWTKAYWAVLGKLRGKTNRENMRKTLERIKANVEGS